MTQLAAIGFGEGTGTTAADSSGNNRTVTAVPGWTTSQTGFGKCLTTTGNTSAGGRLIIPALTTYTVACRIRVRTSPAGSYATIVGHGDGTASGTLHVLLNNLTPTIYYPAGGVFVPSGVTLTPGSWYHVAYTYDGTSGFWVIDGVNAGAAVTTAQPIIASTTGYYIGGSPSFPGDMEVDDLRMYDTSMTTAQIAAIKDVSLEAPAVVSPAFAGTAFDSGAFFTATAVTAAFTGSGTLSAAVSTPVLPVTAAFTGSGTLSATAGIPGQVGYAGLVGKRNLHPSIWSTVLTCTYRLSYPVAVNSSALRLEFPNWATDVAGTGDTASGNTLTLGAVYVETTGGTLYPVTFSGSSTSTLASGASVTSDAVAGLTVTAGQTIYVRTYVTIPSGGRKPRLRGYVNYPAEASIPGSNQANATGSLAQPSDNGSDQYGPLRIWGNVAAGQPKYGVAVIGDSITAGTGDDSANEADYGYWQRALWPGSRPYELLALAGESAEQFLTTQSANRVALLTSSYVSYVVNAYGINDFHGFGATLAQMQARCRAIAARDSTKRWYQITLTPTSTSTDNWATTANQTPGYIQVQRQQFNDWVRDGMPESGGVAVAVGTAGALRAGSAGHPYAGYIEVADYAETARNSSIWKANYTADGIHPSAIAHSAIAAGISLTQFTDTTSVNPSVAADFTGSGTVSATVVEREIAAAALTGSGSLTAATVERQARTAGLAGFGTLTATAVPVVVASAALSGSGSLSAAVVASGAVTAAFDGSGTLTASLSQSQTVAAAFTGSGTLAAATLEQQTRTASLTGSGSLAATSSATASPTFTGSGALTAVVSASFTVAAATSGSGTLTAAAIPRIAVTASFSGSGALSALAGQSGVSVALFAGSGTLSAAIVVRPAVTATFTSSGTLAGAAAQAQPATFSGSGTLTATATPVASSAVTASFTAAGTLAASVVASIAVTANASGAGLLSAQVALRTVLVAAFTGTGSLAASVGTPGGQVDYTLTASLVPRGWTAELDTQAWTGALT